MIGLARALRRGFWMCVLTPFLVAALAGAIVLFLLAAARAHDDAEWIMRGQNSWCCGPKDCFEIEHADVRHEVRAGGEGVYIVTWRGRTHEVPERDAKRSEKSKPWVCEQPDGSIRCLFILPMGA